MKSVQKRSPEYQEMVKAFGSDGTSVVFVNALGRRGVTSVAKLSEMLDEMGEERLTVWMKEIPNVGRVAVLRAFTALAKYREQGKERNSESDAP